MPDITIAWCGPPPQMQLRWCNYTKGLLCQQVPLCCWLQPRVLCCCLPVEIMVSWTGAPLGTTMGSPALQATHNVLQDHGPSDLTGKTDRIQAASPDDASKAVG